MANQSGEMQFNIKFIGQGVKSLEGDVGKMLKSIETTRKAASTIFASGSVESQKFNKALDTLYVGLNSTSKKLQQLAQDTSEESKSLDYLTKTLLTLGGKVGGIINQFGGLKQALNGTTAGISANLKDTINSLEAMGVKSEVVNQLRLRFDKVNEVLKKTGDSTHLLQFNKEVDKSIGVVKKLEAQIEKLNALEINPAAKRNTITQLEATKTGVMSGDVSTAKANVYLSRAVSLTKELTAQEKELNATYKETSSALQSKLNYINKQREALAKNIKLEEGKGTASAEDLLKAKNVLATLDKQAAALTKLSEKGAAAFSPRAINGFANRVTIAIGDVDSLGVSIEKASSGLKLSSQFANSKKYADALKIKIDEIGKSLNKTSSGALKSLTTQLDAVTNKINKGVGTPSSNKDELNEINKKLELLREISKIEDDIRAAGSYNVLKPEDMEKLLNSTRDLKKELDKTGNSVEGLSSKFKSIKTELQGKLTVDTQFDKVIANYQAQIKKLQVIMNSKEKFATTASLKEAEAQIEKLTQELKQAEDAKKKFDAAFQIDASGAVRSASNQVKVLNANLQRSKVDANDVIQKLTKLSAVKWFANITQRAAAYAGIYGGLYGVINLMSRGVGYTLEFNQAVHTLSAVLDMTADSANRLETRLAGLSVRFGGSLKDINEAALALGRAGFDKTEVAAATENIIKMARLTGDSFATSASALITYREVFGDVKDVTTGLTPTVEDLADKLAYVANQSRLSTQDIGTFSNYALAAAKSSGLTANSVSSMAIAFSNAGVNASTIGTQIRRFSTVLSDTSTDVQMFFKQLGVNQDLMTSRLRMGTEESNKVMTEFVTKLKNLSSAEFAQITKGMDILALQSLTLLRNNADEFMRHLEQLNSGVQGEVNKATYVTESYAITWEKLGNSLGEAFRNTVGALLPVANDITNHIIDISKSLTTWAGKVGDDWEGVRKRFDFVMNTMKVAAIALGVSGFGALTVYIYNTVKAMTALEVATKGVAAAFTLIKNHPILIALTAIGAAVAYVGGAFSEAKREVQAFNKEAALAASQDKIRSLQEKYTKTGDANAYKQMLEEQKKAGLLSQDLSLGSNVKNAQSSIQLAQTKALGSSLLSDTGSAELMKVSGTQTQQAIVTAINDVKSAAEEALKTIPTTDIASVKAVTSLIASLESDAKSVISSSEFSDGLNGPEAKKWKDYLTSLNTSSEQLNTAFQNMVVTTKEVVATTGGHGRRNKSKIITQTSVVANPNRSLDQLSIPKSPVVATAVVATAVVEATKKVGTSIVKIISDKEISGIKTMSASIQTQYSKNVNVTQASNKLLGQIDVILKELKSEQATTIAKAIESAPDSGKDLLKAYGSQIQGMTNPVDIEMAFREFSKKLEVSQQAEVAKVQSSGASEADQTTAINAISSKYGGLVAAAKSFNDVNQKTLALETERAKLLDLGKVKISAHADLYKETEARLRTISELENKGKLLSVEQTNAIEGKLVAVTKSKMLETELVALKEKQVQAEARYNSLVAQRVALEAKAKAFNASGSKDKETAKKLEEDIKNINKQINETYTEQTKTITDVLSKNNEIIAAKTEEVRLQKEIRAQYLDALNSTSIYSKDLETLQEIQRLLNTGMSAGEATGLVAKKAARDNTVLGRTMSSTSFVNVGAEGASNPEGTKENINAQFDQVDANINAQRLAAEQNYQLSLASIKDLAGITELDRQNRMYQQEQQLKAQYDELTIQSTENTVARQKAIKEAELGAYVANAQTAFTAIGNIANAYYQISGKKSKTAAKVMQGVQVAQAIANTYLSATSAYSSMSSIPIVGPALGAAAAAAAIAAGMANVAQIKAQTYHTGGYVTDDNRAGLRSDEIPAVLQTGEYVLSRNDLKAIKETSGGSQAPAASPQNSEVVIVNSMDTSVIEQYLSSRAGRQIINNSIKR